VDTTKPVVTLTGSAIMTVECHTSFADPGASASDTCAGTLTVSTTGTVNVNSPGSYTLTYSATDPTGNIGSATRTVNVVDTSAPVVTLTGSAIMTVECHTSFTDPGATASDTCAGTLTVTTTGSVNVNSPGSYTLTYTATDPSLNTGTATRTVNVVDTTKPVINCPSDISSYTTTLGGTIVTFSATAQDTCTGTITPACVPPSGSSFALGVTTVNCTATDGSQNSSTCSFTVTLLPNHAPIAGDNNMGALNNRAQKISLEKILANDSDSDGDVLTITTVSSSSTNGGSVTLSATGVTYLAVPGFVGTDRFTYTVSDGKGASATANVTVLVRSGNDPALNRIGEILITPSGIKITFAGIPDSTYSVERSSDLTHWSPIGTLALPDNGIGEFTDSAPPTGSGFYRMVAQE
jgi:hypothetical protein